MKLKAANMKCIVKKRHPARLEMLVVSILVLVCGVYAFAYAGQFREISSFGRNPGNLRMFAFIPDNVSENAPLVVSLHGCRQDATVYSTNGWKDVAEHYKFYVLFPEQKGGFFGGNNPIACFNWFEPGDTKRNSGEAQSIKNMIDKMTAEYAIDKNRIFIEGLSAGGYMTAVMLAAWPDVFAGGAIHAGGPAYCASNAADAYGCMGGIDRSPESWGRLVRTRGLKGYTGPWPKVSIWHGTADGTVDPVNQRELVDQWTNVHGIDQIPDKTGIEKGYPHEEYHDDQGNVLVETWSITGMSHATPVDPGFAATNGCGSTSAYVLDKGICSVFHIARFWGLDEHTASIAAPAMK